MIEAHVTVLRHSKLTSFLHKPFQRTSMTDQRTIPQRPMGKQGFVTSQQGLGCMGE